MSSAEVLPKHEGLSHVIDKAIIAACTCRVISFDNSITIAFSGAKSSCGEAETACVWVFDITRQRTVLPVERIHGSIEFLHLSDGGSDFCRLDEVTTGQDSSDDEPDDDEYDGKLNQCEARSDRAFRRISGGGYMKVFHC
jgi:hypothetical protein